MGTRHMKLKLTVYLIPIGKWWVYAQYNISEDCKGYIGAIMLLVKRSVNSLYRRQNLNTWGLTESELLGADNSIILVLWLKYLIEAQIYSVEQNKMYQYNQPTMIFEANRFTTSPQITNHVNAGDFLIRDNIKKGTQKSNIIQLKNVAYI